MLDGQQRLTSLYIGLKGSYAYKLSYKRWDNEQAYPVRKLYLNLLMGSEDTEYEYEFEFLTDSEAKNNDEKHHWFPVGKILDLKEQSEVNEYLIENDLSSNPDKAKAKFANKALFKLHTVIHTTPIISYYLEQSKELDKVLNIFIRVNSGGTTLSYSDLLLSFATAQWDDKDAREEINTKDRAKIKKWFTLSLLKRVLSFMPDGVLKPVRDIIQKNTTGEFPIDEIINQFRGTNRTLVFTDEDINNLMYSKYGQGDTLVIMSILYPWADLRNNFHIDHMHPKSSFTKKKLQKRGVPEDSIEFYLENYNYIGNLQ